MVDAGKFDVWMLPQLFAYAMNFPIQKFLQAQRKVMVMAWVSAVVLVLHAFFSWLLIFKLGWGLVGAAITLNTSCWLIVIGQLLYTFISICGSIWLCQAFSSFCYYVMACFCPPFLFMLYTESWYYPILILKDVMENELQLGVLVLDVADSHNRSPA